MSLSCLLFCVCYFQRLAKRAARIRMYLYMCKWKKEIQFNSTFFFFPCLDRDDREHGSQEGEPCLTAYDRRD